MRTTLPAMVSLALLICSASSTLGQVECVFFSEYVEGSASNKALEIYNGSTGPVSLYEAEILIYVNGSSTPTTTTLLEDILQPGETFVIANPSFLWPQYVDMFSHNISFNGDDAIELRLLDTTMDVIGRIGEDLDLEQAQEAARLAAIDMLSSLKAEIGDLNKVVRIVKLTGYINAVDSFGEHPQVTNGASDLLIEVFGDPGIHARSSVGVSSLPLGTSIETEMVVEVRND